METHSALIYSAESSISLLACDPFPHLSCFKVHGEVNPTFHTQSTNTETISGGGECVFIHEELMEIEQKGAYLGGQSSLLQGW